MPIAAVAHHRPHWSEVRQTVQLRRSSLSLTQRRLDNALSIGDLRTIARRTTPRSVFDYVDGAAEDEISARRNVRAYEELIFHPQALRPVDHPDTSVRLFGRTIPLPLGFGATGYTRMMHHHGEAAVARVAQHFGIPYGLSTVGTTTVEDVRAAAPEVDLWFQLYVTSDPQINDDLIKRAHNAGCTTLVLTCDTAVSGNRRKDDRNGLTIPPTLRPSTIIDMGLHPYWWVNKLTTDQITFASLAGAASTYNFNQIASKIFDPSVGLDSLGWVRERWPGRLLVKGILSTKSAREAVDGGADGVIISNHGGRQLDRTPAPITLVPAVRKELGPDVPILVDSGIRNGQDIVAARALGADAALVGRAYLYGIMAGGQDGVVRAYEILAAEYQRAMQLLGVRHSGDLSDQHVTLPGARPGA
ncbi:alpha-hydroxy acid oxidase [Microlunatus endophyticus]|uniref:alpha-hydroxy acid oxidase n=1 Tax=Microlunatus endophyticus TaxID=1716077 RepID=UPI001E52548F|nr:alpha-hydroxy acid oxidase [Microlunatus endophyticus]